MNKKVKKETEAQRKGRLNRIRGQRSELRVIKLLKSKGFHGIVSSRSESKNLDNDLIDIADPNNVLPCYIQNKISLSNPQYQRIITDCPRKDKPMVIFHDKQYKREDSSKQYSQGRYCITTEDFMVELLVTYALAKGLIKEEDTNKEKENEDSNNHSDSLSE